MILQACRRLTFDYKENDAVPAEMKEILSQFDATKSGCAHSLPEGSIKGIFGILLHHFILKHKIFYGC